MNLSIWRLAFKSDWLIVCNVHDYTSLFKDFRKQWSDILKSRIINDEINVRIPFNSILYLGIWSVSWHYHGIGAARCGPGRRRRRHRVTNNIRGRHLCDVMALNRNASIYVPLLLFVRCLFYFVRERSCHWIEVKQSALLTPR